MYCIIVREQAVKRKNKINLADFPMSQLICVLALFKRL